MWNKNNERETPAPTFCLRASAVSLPGPKQSNDDRYVMTTLKPGLFTGIGNRVTVRGGRPFLAAVADGVSSTRDKGEIARFAVKRLAGLFQAQTDPYTWLETVNQGASCLYLDPNQAVPFPSGATTLSLLAFTGQKVFAANVGDSPIVRVRQGTVTPLYQPHTERPQPPLAVWNGGTERYGALLNFIGNPYYRPSQESGGWWDVQPGDVYVVCSDGAAWAITLPRLLRYLDTARVPSAGRLLHDCAGRIKDDSTLILIQVLPGKI